MKKQEGPLCMNIFDKLLIITGVAVLLIGMFVSIWFTIHVMYPADYWYSLTRLDVKSMEEGGSPELTLHRVVHRDFTGTRYVTVFESPGMEPACRGNVTEKYQTRMPPPANVTLDEWVPRAHPPCVEAMKPGEYLMQVCVSIQPPNFLLTPRETCVDSNIFTVYPRGEKPDEPPGIAG